MKTNFQFNFNFSGLILFILISVNSFAQINWVKDASNPVLEGVSGNWNQEVWHPVVIYEEQLFKMWFLAYYSGNYQVGYAESIDGLNWDMLEYPVIPSGQPGEWDRYKAPHTVIRMNDTLKMWYHGSTNWADNFSIGYAWSVIEHEWNFLPDPVLVKGGNGSWDDTYVYNPTVYYDGDQFQMWYSASGDGWYDEIGYATSDDGIEWNKDYINSPVIELGDPGTFYDEWVMAGPVIVQDGLYHMWFCGFDGTDYFKIGYAASLNGIYWTVENNMEPVVDIGAPGSWDDETIRVPSVLIHDGIYKMWYGGGGTLWKIGYALGDPVLQIINVPEDQPTIQAGIDIADSGDTVLVDQGIYYENINFKGKAITVASQYINDSLESQIENTIIDGGQPHTPDSASVVSFISGEDTASVLCGFTIRNGTGTYPDAWGDRSGGGIFCNNSGATIVHNRIIDNNITTTISGAFGSGVCALFPNNQTGVLVLKYNLIAHNELKTFVYPHLTYGGGAYIQNYDLVITDNIVDSNSVEGWSHGAGLSLGNCTGIVTNNMISNNVANVTYAIGLGGGLFIAHPRPELKINQNTIFNNSCTGGTNRGGGIGVLNWGSNGDYTFDKNLITENMAERGGAIGMALSEPGCLITNNVIKDNKADEIGGGISFHSSSGEDLGQNQRRGELNQSNITAPEKGGLLPKIINNTIIYNDATSLGGGIYNGLDGSDVLAFNNIVYENDASYGAAVLTQLTTSTTHLYNNDIDTNLIYGSWSGANNIYVDPELDDDGYHLLPTSPCKEAGANQITILEQPYYCPELDIDGDLRPFNNFADIGADELDIPVRTRESNLANNLNSLHNFPNPFAGSTTISFVLDSDGFTELSMFDLSGKRIQIIINEKLPAGNHEIKLNASGLNSGIYFCVLKTNKGMQTKKLIKLD